ERADERAEAARRRTRRPGAARRRAGRAEPGAQPRARRRAAGRPAARGAEGAAQATADEADEGRRRATAGAEEAALPDEGPTPPALQKYTVRPWNSLRYGVLCRSTLMPQTGSLAPRRSVSAMSAAATAKKTMFSHVV